MKTAGRENPNRGGTLPRNRAHGAVGQNRSCSIKRAAKKEKPRPRERCFSLTSPFIELHGTWLQELRARNGASDRMGRKEVIERKTTMMQPYDVIRTFEATAPISGRRRRFEPGDVIAYEMGQRGPTVTIEVDASLFLVDRTIFKTCCKFKNAGGSAY
jgi:hypothetical protein